MLDLPQYLFAMGYKGLEIYASLSQISNYWKISVIKASQNKTKRLTIYFFLVRNETKNITLLLSKVHIVTIKFLL